MIRAEGDEAEPLWPIVVEVVGLPGAERHPRKVSVEVNGHTHVGNLCDMISRKAGLWPLLTVLCILLSAISR